MEKMNEDLERDYVNELNEYLDKINNEFCEYMERVGEYVQEMKITSHTRFYLWFSSGPWRAYGELVNGPPATYKGIPLGINQVFQEMRDNKRIMGSAFYCEAVYLARTGERLIYPLADICEFL